METEVAVPFGRTAQARVRDGGHIYLESWRMAVRLGRY
jgi:hypothetical protein